MSFGSEDKEQQQQQAGTLDQTVAQGQTRAGLTAQAQAEHRGQQTSALPASALEQALQEYATQHGLSQIEMAKALGQASQQVGVAPTAGQQAMGTTLNDIYLQQLRDRAMGGNVISPQAQAQIDRAYGAAQQLGIRDIEQQSMQDAQRRGLSVTDSPVANAKALGLADFASRLQAAKAQATLDYGSQEANRATAFDQYQKELQQRAFQNRLALIGQAPAAYGLQSNLFNQRLAQGLTQQFGQAQNRGAVNDILSGNTRTTGSSTGLFSGAGSGTQFGLSGRDLAAGVGAGAQIGRGISSLFSSGGGTGANSLSGWDSAGGAL